MYPLLMNMTNRKVLVVGGGRVASRKLVRLIAEGADVTLLSPFTVYEIQEMAKSHKNLKLNLRSYDSELIEGYEFVFCCTDDRAVNELVARDAKVTGALVNICDDLDDSDFILPSVSDIGGIKLFFSTGGLAPFLAAHIREDMECRYSKFDAEYVNLLGDIRRMMIDRKMLGGSTELGELLVMSKQELREFQSSLDSTD